MHLFTSIKDLVISTFCSSNLEYQIHLRVCLASAFTYFFLFCLQCKTDILSKVGLFLTKPSQTKHICLYILSVDVV